MQPMFGFTAVSHECVNKPHMHHGYRRFDLDIDGAANDVIKERRRFLFFFRRWVTLSSEQTRLRTSSNSRRWQVVDASTGRGIRVEPGQHDVVGGDPFGGPDVWALRYHGNEIDDGGATGGPLVTRSTSHRLSTASQSIDQDVVMWYRVGLRHEHGPHCTLVGPTIASGGQLVSGLLRTRSQAGIPGRVLARSGAYLIMGTRPGAAAHAPEPPAPDSAPTRSPPPSAKAGWERSTAPTTIDWGAASPSRSCPRRSRRIGTVAPLRARGARHRRAEPPPHLRHPRRRPPGRRGLPGDGAARRRVARRSARARSPAVRRGLAPSRSPSSRRWPPCTSAA